MQLVVVVHGTGRAFTEYRDAFAAFAKWNDCIVLCPLFPAGPQGDGNRDGFKHLREADIRYDQILLEHGRRGGASSSAAIFPNSRSSAIRAAASSSTASACCTPSACGRCPSARRARSR
jgi:hypothetical protein